MTKKGGITTHHKTFCNDNRQADLLISGKLRCTTLFVHLVQVSHGLKLQFDFDRFGQTIHIQAHTDRGLCTHDKYNTGKNIHPETDGDIQDVGHGQTRL